MEEFRAVYSVFYRDLKDFIDHLPTIYRPDRVRGPLQNVRLLLTVLPEDDRDFDLMKTDSITQKTAIVLQATRLVLEKVGPYVRPETKDQFKKEARMLTWKSDVVTLQLTALAPDEDASQVSILSSGIGGTNTGVRQNINYETMEKLRDMCSDLQSY